MHFSTLSTSRGAAQGQTILVSTGDSGSAGCDDDNTQYYAHIGQPVSGYASTPYNVAVGGTDFYYSQYSNAALCSTNTYDPATGVSTGTLSGYPKPSWQSGTGVPTDGVRDTPDVSLFASSGANLSYYPICYADGDCQSVSSGSTVQFTAVGGTLGSAPSFAGIMALINQKHGPQGQADYVLYPLFKQFHSAFHDVTNGPNSVPCSYSPGSPNCNAVSNPITVTDPNLGAATEGQIGTGTGPEYNATPGYDLASGLGTVDANVLVTDWSKVSFTSTTTTLSPSSPSFAHGTAITVSGSVTAGSGTPTTTWPDDRLHATS